MSLYGADVGVAHTVLRDPAVVVLEPKDFNRGHQEHGEGSKGADNRSGHPEDGGFKEAHTSMKCHGRLFITGGQ